MNSNAQPKEKKPLLKIISTTFLGGFLVILPGYLAILAFNKMIKGLVGLIFVFLKPIAAMLGLAESDIAIPVASIIFIIICFIAGVIVKSSYARIFKKSLEPIFMRIPGYLLIRSIIRRIARMEESQNMSIAFVAVGEVHEALSPGFLIEHHDNGFYTVFVPTVPTPTVGNIYLIPEDKVFIVDVPFLDMVKFITKWGQSSPALIAAINQLQPTKNQATLSPSENG
ncbi:MAG: DUF502 domain-containing protein [Xenococcus sp. (in: cyanobacteria)]